MQSHPLLVSCSRCHPLLVFALNTNLTNSGERGRYWIHIMKVSLFYSPEDYCILAQVYYCAPAARSTAAHSALLYLMAIARAVYPMSSCDTFDGQMMGGGRLEGRYVVFV